MTVAELANVIGFKVKENDVQKVNNTIKNIKSTATKLLGAIGIGFSLKGLNSLAEEFSKVGDRINMAVSETEALGDASKLVLQGAQNCKTAYATMAEEVLALKKNNQNLFPLKDAIQFTENINKIGKVARLDDAAIASLHTTMQGVMTAGQLGAQQLQKIGQDVPGFVKQLAAGLGVTEDKIKSMAASGQLTAATIKEAMLKATDSINIAYDQLGYNVSDALLHIRNAFGFWVAETDKMFGITTTIGGFMVKTFDKIMGVLNKVRDGFAGLAKIVGGNANLLRLLAYIAGSIFLAFHFNEIINGLKTVFKMLTLQNLGVALLIAIITALALVVEDFVYFMQGKESLLGLMFEKAGISADEMRQKIINIGQNLKTFFAGIWEAIVNSPAIEKLKNKIKEIFGDESLASAGNFLAALIGKIEEATAKLAENKELQQFIADIVLAIAKMAPILAIAIPLIKKLSTAFTLLSIGISGASKVGGAISGVFKTVSGVFTKLSPTVLIVIGVIAALVAIGVVLYKNWDTVKEKLTAIWNTIKSTAESVFAPLKKFWEQHGQGVKDILTSAWNGISTFLSDIWGGIKSAATDVFNGLKNYWDKHGEQIKEAFSNIWNRIKEIFSTVWEVIKGIFKAAVSVISAGVTAAFDRIKAFWDTWGETIKTVFRALWDTVKSIFSGAWEIIKAVVGSALDVITDIFAVFAAAFAGDWSGVWENIKQLGSDIWEGIKSIFSAVFGSIADTAKTIWNGLKDYLGSIWYVISGVARSVWEGVVSFFAGIWESISNGITTAWNAITGFFSGIWETIKSIFSGSSEETETALSGVWDRIFGKITEVWEGISGFFSGIWNKITGIFKGKADESGQSVGSAWDTVGSDTSSKWSGIQSTLTSTWDSISSSASGIWNGIKTTLVNLTQNSGTSISTIWTNLKSSVTTIWNNLSSSASTIFGNIKNRITTLFTQTKSSVGNLLNNMSSNFRSSTSSILSTASSAFNRIKTAMTNPINAAKSTISSILSGIKSRFPMSIGNIFTNIRLPHISVSGGSAPFGIGGKGSLPRFSVSWYKKGGILNGAQIFGALGGKLLGGGEAGKEAVLPLTELWKNMRSIANTVADRMDLSLSRLTMMGRVSPGTVSTVTNTSTSTRNVVMNVNMSNSFNGERSVQRDAARAFDAAGTELTSQLARAMANTR